LWLYSIVDHTNILALNAATAAASATEAGQEFAVVADSVRHLFCKASDPGSQMNSVIVKSQLLLNHLSATFHKLNKRDWLK